MRLFKIVSFSVVILLVTVLFAGVVTVPSVAQGNTTSDLSGAVQVGTSTVPTVSLTRDPVIAEMIGAMNKAIFTAQPMICSAFPRACTGPLETYKPQLISTTSFPAFQG